LISFDTIANVVIVLFAIGVFAIVLWPLKRGR
jgi:cbb3-type cytochrome oxidase subunit 3